MKVWLLLLLLLCPLVASADDTTKLESSFPFRTDSTNREMPWYQLKPGEFPPLHSEHRVGGELVQADFIHRRGQFRTTDTGELVDFTLPSFGSVRYLNTDADLRDVPLGTYFVFFLYQDEAGNFTKVATMRDEYSLLAGEGLSYRFDEAKLDQGKILVNRRSLALPAADLGHEEFLVNDKTRVWKGDQQIKLAELLAGEMLLVNLTGSTASIRGRCTDIWVGPETQKLATEKQRKTHVAFLKKRGLPAWIDRVEGKKITVTLFGDPADVAALFKDDGIVPTQWATEHRGIDAVVANDELRTYNPPVDRQRSPVQQFESAATDCYGSSGIRFTLQPNLLIEGFRARRIVRLFVHPAWPVEDMAFGENVFSEAPGYRADLEEPIQYPFRTDFANKNLPWYQLKAGEFPPLNSHHLVVGELTKIDAIHRSGQFRTDGTGELVDFTMPPFGSVRYLNSEADLSDLPLATRCRFFLYQDDRGAFTKAAVIMDQFSRIDQFTRILGDKLTYRVEAANLDEGKLLLADQLALVQNYKGDMVRPPDVGHGEFAVDDKTRVWKGDQQIRLADLVVGDELLLNQTGRTATSRGHATDIWVGADTLKLVTDRQRERHNSALKEHGFPAWIDSVEGKELGISFFSGPGMEFQGFFHDGPPGGNVKVTLVDDQLAAHGTAIDAVKFKKGFLADTQTGNYGYRGARWLVESEQAGSYHSGQIIRVFDAAWPIPPAPDH